MNNIQQEDMDSTKKRIKDTGNTDNSIIMR